MGRYQDRFILKFGDRLTMEIKGYFISFFLCEYLILEKNREIAVY